MDINDHPTREYQSLTPGAVVHCFQSKGRWYTAEAWPSSFEAGKFTGHLHKWDGWSWVVVHARTDAEERRYPVEAGLMLGMFCRGAERAALLAIR